MLNGKKIKYLINKNRKTITIYSFKRFSKFLYRVTILMKNDHF